VAAKAALSGLRKKHARQRFFCFSGAPAQPKSIHHIRDGVMTRDSLATPTF
jgi:hypothetical protein